LLIPPPSAYNSWRYQTRDTTLGREEKATRVSQEQHTERPREILVVADVHLNSEDPEAREAFYGFLDREAVGNGLGTIVFLGDLFDLWLGPPRLQEAHHRELALRLGALRARGMQLAYIEGNRDLFVARHQRGLFHRVAEGGLLLRRGGRRFSLVHGDRLNRIDYNYRAWNMLVRNRAAHLLLRFLPRGWTLRAAAALEHRLRGTNRRFRTYFPHTQCERYAREQFRRGADVVLMGHFHRRLHFDFPDLDADEGGARGGEVYVVPDWLTRRAALRIDGGGHVGLVGEHIL